MKNFFSRTPKPAEETAPDVAPEPHMDPVQATPPKAPPPSFAPPPAILIGNKGGPRPLTLPRRASPLVRAQEATAATVAARRSIDAILSRSRPPWGGPAALDDSQVTELQKAVQALEAKVVERDAAVAVAQAKLSERERELAEAEALLAARERVLAASRQQTEPASGGGITPEQTEAMQKLKEELDRQEASLNEQRAALKDREEFLNQSEEALFSKMQQQQEKETELEQREEDLKRRMRQAGLLKDEPPEPMEKA